MWLTLICYTASKLPALMEVAALVIGFAVIALLAVYICCPPARRAPRYWMTSRLGVLSFDFPDRTTRHPATARLTATEIHFWNAGRRAIAADDVQGDEPLRIVARGDVVFWDARILGTNAPDANFRVDVTHGTPRAVIGFEAIRKDQGVRIELLHTGSSNDDLEVRGSVRDSGAPQSSAEDPVWLLAEPAARIIAPLELRVQAATWDLAVVLGAFAIVVAIQALASFDVVLNRNTVTGYIGTIALLGVLYAAMLSIAGIDSYGMRQAKLRLATFEGSAPDAAQRAARLLGKSLSIAGLGLGLVWLFVDRERLGWHDRISRTFPVAVSD